MSFQPFRTAGWGLAFGICASQFARVPPWHRFLVPVALKEFISSNHL